MTTFSTTIPAWQAHDTGAAACFTMICRRRRLGQNSWLHGAARDGKAETAVWVSPHDLARLGIPHGGAVLLQTANATLHVSAIPVADVAQGLVVMPHGLPGVNVNALIPSGIEMLEPLSGQHRMTGIPVRLTTALPVSDSGAPQNGGNPLGWGGTC